MIRYGCRKPSFRKGHGGYKQKTDCAIVIIHNGKGEVVTVKEPYRKSSRWKFAGGHFDPTTETPEEAGVREAKEECGMDIDPATLVPLPPEPKIDHTIFPFAIRVDEDFPGLLLEGNESGEWAQVSTITDIVSDWMGQIFLLSHHELMRDNRKYL